MSRLLMYHVCSKRERGISLKSSVCLQISRDALLSDEEVVLNLRASLGSFYCCMRRLELWMQAIEEINMQTGANMDPNADANELMQQTTRGLMAAVSRLPQLTERKRTLDKHTNLLHHLLRVSSYQPFAESCVEARQSLTLCCISTSCLLQAL